MALSQKSMKLGPIYLGVWLYDCSQLKSGIRLSTKRPTASLEISFGKDVGATIQAGLSVLPGDLAKKVGGIVKKNFPQISGKIFISIEAEPITKICHEKNGNNVQTVGWDAAVQITIQGTIKTAAAEIKGKVVIPILLEGDRVDCECNEALTIADKFAIEEREKTVSMLPQPAGSSISKNQQNFITKQAMFTEIIENTIDEINKLTIDYGC
ncbi:hypothetical protein [Tenacibaculum agarivorans]|uniref:hypothetical protein n=1 Tax=Tenacibaculum agarivorans TaxID=1908389 RepID=UPI00094B7F48|nr:hypothetical protein [Tenacibaculum agarivorans]